MAATLGSRWQWLEVVRKVWKEEKMCKKKIERDREIRSKRGKGKMRRRKVVDGGG